MSAQEILEQVSIAWIEGRLENVLERQKQLAALHQNFQKKADTIIRALQQDLKSSADLATSELTVALDAINTIYDQLDFQDVLAKERSLKNGGSSASFLVPLGTVLVVQLSSSPLVSTLGPIAAALAAGNPTVVLGSPTVPTTNAILQQIVLDSLDREAFHFEKSVNTSNYEDFTQKPYAVATLQDLRISQTIGPLVRAANPSIRLVEPYYGIPAGLIDRSALGSLDTAVEQINQIVLSNSTSNPLRIPRLFFVDESVVTLVKDKLQARQENNSGDLEGWLQKHYKGLIPRFSDQNSHSPGLPKVEKFSTFTTTSGGEIGLITTTSLDHSIDLLNKINAGAGSQAIYIFASRKEAFYLGNFITTSHVFINEIPSRALVLASSRSAHDTSSCAYRLEDFSESKTMLQGSHYGAKKPAKLNAKKVKQYQGGRMSYFEQGLILGVAMGLVTLAGFGFLSYRGVRTYLMR